MSLRELLDPWDYQYVKNLADADKVYWHDEAAFYGLPHLRWVYDKLNVLRNYGSLKVWDLEREIPDEWPVMVKPRFNFSGMGRGAHIAWKPWDILNHRGMIAQELATGPHLSVDCAVLGGKLVSGYTMRATSNELGFSGFTRQADIPQFIVDHVEGLGIDKAVLNLEFIGEHLIEMHARPSIQFFDISGGFLSGLPAFVLREEVPDMTLRPGYSRVFRREKNATISVVTPLPSLPTGVSSVQCTFLPDSPLSVVSQSEESYRFLIINGTDGPTIERFGAQVVRDCLEFHPPIIL